MLCTAVTNLQFTSLSNEKLQNSSRSKPIWDRTGPPTPPGVLTGFPEIGNTLSDKIKYVTAYFPPPFSVLTDNALRESSETQFCHHACLGRTKRAWFPVLALASFLTPPHHCHWPEIKMWHQEMWDRRRKTWGVRQEMWYRRQEKGDKSCETGDARQVHKAKIEVMGVNFSKIVVQIFYDAISP